jgi:DNA-binding protein HU-beta
MEVGWVNRAELASRIADGAGLTKRDAVLAVDVLVEVVGEALQQGGVVRLRGLGTLEVVQRKPKVGRNPQTGERIHVPAHRAVRFRAAKVLREALG